VFQINGLGLEVWVWGLRVEGVHRWTIFSMRPSIAFPLSTPSRHANGICLWLASYEPNLGCEPNCSEVTSLTLVTSLTSYELRLDYEPYLGYEPYHSQAMSPF